MKKVLCSMLIGTMLLSTLSSFAMPINEFENGMRKGVSYFNQGLYYEAIDEIQNFCDVFWYDMTAEQQEKALYYLWQSKNNLADYLFNTGVGYYNRGLYYEAQRVFVEAIGLYPEYSTSWRNANDYLYNTNEKIKSLENWIWVKDYYFNFIGKTRTQIDNILGPITETVWNNVPYYRHRNDRNTLFCYDNFVGADYMAASYAICDGVETTVGGLVGVSNSYNIAYGLRNVFTYDTFFIDEYTKEWCWVYKHNGYVIMINDSNISLNSRAYIYKEK